MPVPANNFSPPRLVSAALATLVAFLVLPALVSPRAGAEATETTGGGAAEAIPSAGGETTAATQTAVPTAVSAQASDPVETEVPDASAEVPSSTATATETTVEHSAKSAVETAGAAAERIPTPRSGSGVGGGPGSSFSSSLVSDAQATQDELVERTRAGTVSPDRDPVSLAAGAAKSAVKDTGAVLTERVKAIGEASGLGAQIDSLVAIPAAPAAPVATAPANAGPVPLVTGALSPAKQGRLIGASLGAGEANTTYTDASHALPDGTPASSSLAIRSAPHGSLAVQSALALRSDGTNLTAPAERSGGPPPLEAPTPPAGSFEGSAGSFFIPLAALLALLALAAPATHRRLGRGADFRPPIPFVCALERPG